MTDEDTDAKAQAAAQKFQKKTFWALSRERDAVFMRTAGLVWLLVSVPVYYFAERVGAVLFFFGVGFFIVGTFLVGYFRRRFLHLTARQFDRLDETIRADLGLPPRKGSGRNVWVVLVLLLIIFGAFLWATG